MSLTLALLLATLAPAAGDPFPVPSGMSANVRFWLRVYTEWPTNRYAIHDDQDLDVVYQVIAATDGRSATVKQAKADVEAALARLDAKRPGSASGLTGLDLEVYRALSRSSDPVRFARARGHVRHQKGQKDRFAEALRESGRYRRQIEDILSRREVPKELIALIFVESMFKNHARSYSGALGLWQFMSYTGKEYLNINSVVDERRDPVIATYAAATYLRTAHRRLEVWPVAITSYNYGMNGMARAIKAVGSRDLAKIVAGYRSGRLGFAAKNYYTEFLAALEVWRNPKRYFPGVKPRPMWRYDVVRLPAETSVPSLVRAGAVTLADIKSLNPALTSQAIAGKVRLPQGLSLRLPHGTGSAFVAAFAKIPDARRSAAARGERRYTVRPGDNVTAIARRHGVTTGQVLTANNLARDQHIHAGMELTIPPKRSSFTLLPEARSMPVPDLPRRRGVAVAAVAPPPTAPPETKARTPRVAARTPTRETERKARRERGRQRARVVKGPARRVRPPAPVALESEIAVDVLSGGTLLPMVDVTCGGRPPSVLRPEAPAGEV